MNIRVHKKFKKQYELLSELQKKRVDKAILLFVSEPFAYELKNHALKGVLDGKRSFSAGFDLRIVYEDKNDHFEVLLLRVGNHNHVY